MIVLAEHFSEPIEALARSLLDHQQPWTRLAAWCLVLHVDSVAVDLDHLERVDSDLLAIRFPRKYRPTGTNLRDWVLSEDCGRAVQSLTIGKATELLIRLRSGQETTTRLRTALMNQDIDAWVKERIATVLEDAEVYRDLLHEWRQSWMKSLSPDLGHLFANCLDADLVTLDAAAQATGLGLDSTQTDIPDLALVNLAASRSAANFNNVFYFDSHGL